MPTTEDTIWGIHAGRSGEADVLFREKKFIALGWSKMGNLKNLHADRDSFKADVAAKYPDKNPYAIPGDAGVLFRFVHEMKQGDLVVYPSKIDRQINIGRVDGDYRYDATLAKDSPHLRSVKWLKTLPRTGFSQGALYEIGSALTLFQVRNHASEFISAMEGHVAPAPPVGADPTVAAVAEDTEENTRDFVLKRLLQELKGHPFAEFVAHLLSCMGYRTRLSPPGPDGGVDIIAHKDELGFEPPIVKVQVKSSEASVSRNEVSDLSGTLGSANEFGLFVTLGLFSAPARNFAQGKSNLRLIDAVEVVDLVLAHYDQLDSRYKGLIPLKRVYVPEPLDDGTE